MNDNFKNKVTAVWGVVKKYAKKVWEYVKVAKMELIVMIALFAVDLISKALVDANVALNATVVLIPKFLNITYVRNYDAAFGSDWMRQHLGIGARIIFCIFAVVASVVFIIILIKNKKGHRLVRVGLAMLVAGAMGNCIDRMALGFVRDFIEFEYFGGTIFGRSSFWIFNIADASLVIGVILVVIYYLIIYKGKDDKKTTLMETADQDADGKTDDGATPSHSEADASLTDKENADAPHVADEQAPQAEDTQADDEQRSGGGEQKETE